MSDAFWQDLAAEVETDPDYAREHLLASRDIVASFTDEDRDIARATGRRTASRAE